MLYFYANLPLIMDVSAYIFFLALPILLKILLEVYNNILLKVYLPQSLFY